ncbi:LPXTG cell wall anchor domain-containing protein, partial [Candidatus Altiarchaeota archaeon]
LSISSVVLVVYFLNIVFQVKINQINAILIILAISAIGGWIGFKRREKLPEDKKEPDVVEKEKPLFEDQKDKSKLEKSRTKKKADKP